jgi:enterochelin esterase-like enzyme
MGSSMGGLISLYALAEYPNVFGGAGCLSTHWPLPAFDLLMRTPQIEQEHSVSAFKQYLSPRLKTLKNHKLWLDHGTETLDRLYGPYQVQMDAFLRALPAGQGPVWTSRVYPGAAHNEASWRAHIDDPLVFLLGTGPGNSKNSKQ